MHNLAEPVRAHPMAQRAPVWHKQGKSCQTFLGTKEPNVTTGIAT
jgi:hypothetical protein